MTTERTDSRVRKGFSIASSLGPLHGQMDRLCNNCGLTWGAHRADPRNETCPAHEGRMDWEEGPGSVFSDSGELVHIERGTPARRTR